MANRRWTSNDQLRQRPDSGSRPSPGVGGRKAARSERESAVPYPGAPGPKGKGWNPQRLGFHEVKAHVKQDLADDIYGNSPGLIGPPLDGVMEAGLGRRYLGPPSIIPGAGPGPLPPEAAGLPGGPVPMPGMLPGGFTPMGLRGRRAVRKRGGFGRLY